MLVPVDDIMDWVTCQLRSEETNEANECMCDGKRGATPSQLFESSSNGGQRSWLDPIVKTCEIERGSLSIFTDSQPILRRSTSRVKSAWSAPLLYFRGLVFSNQQKVKKTTDKQPKDFAIEHHGGAI